jgi:3-deoxy-D-manno-octulosonic acid kinase
LPEGYERIDTRGASAFVWSAAREPVERALEEHGTLRDWAGALANTTRLDGRGTVRAIDAPAPGPDRHERWAVRSYLRGGAVAAWLGDRYLKTATSRPEGELRASWHTRARGIPTPAIVAGATYPAGALYYRADLVTEFVPSAVDLAAVLFGPVADTRVPDPADALHAAGALLAHTAAAGIYHPDLNAKNIVLEADGSPTTAHLIDLDRCRVRRRPRASDEQTMRARLERSLQKHATRAGIELPETHLQALRAGIEAGRAKATPA